MTSENLNSDSQILQLILNENKMEEGFRLLMSVHQKSLYTHVRRMLQNHDDTADVLQNVFVKVYKAIKKFEGKSALSTWLYRIATNETLTHIDKRKRTIKSHNDNDYRLSILKAEVYVEESEIISLLQRAVSKLPEKQRLVFNMRYYEEMTYQQISEVLDVTVGGLKASFHHAIKKVEVYVKENQML